jgi:hypothetical protein
MLTGKQGQHIRGLHGLDGGPQVVSLPAYAEMRVKHSKTKVAAEDARSLIGTATKNIAEAKVRLKVLDEKLKAQQAVLDSYGKLLPFKRTP